MTSKQLSVAIVWHQHQPFYRDLMTGEHMMPWVRLHAVKDYLDMAVILEEFPEMRLTINLVPSLVEQMEEFAKGEVKEPWLQLAERPAKDLTEEERVLLLQRFFSANTDTMIAPHARYHDLLKKRGHAPTESDLKSRARKFTVDDLRDLQVWFHLAWTDPLHFERDPELRALREKGHGFTEEEKIWLLGRHRQIIADVIPAHRRLQEAGQLEVTTTPLCHPILPLLCDTNWAREARPQIALPRNRFRHPEDAETQIRLGLEFMTERLGHQPRGMWPSEGSVCPEVIPILARAGVEWIATDEEVLALSLGIPPFHRDRHGRVNNMDALYRPYRIEVDGQSLNMVFRDHELSDFIGFHAAGIDPQVAADTLISRLRDIEFFLREAPGEHMVSIILDGENCWEFYREDGLPFLRALYGGLCKEPALRPMRVCDFLDENPPEKVLPRLHAGSWINHDFSIWIGHEEDNRSWDYLHQTRERVMKHIEANRDTLKKEQVAQAWNAILVAEGSDWNWWYGDDHSSGMDDAFDDLYRRHLAAAHRAVGLEPAAEVQLPITSGGDTGAHVPPRDFLEISVDGRDTHFFEWSGAGLYNPRHGGGAMHRAESVIGALRYGFNTSHLMLRVDLLDTLWDRAGQSQVTVAILIHEPRPLRLEIPLPPQGEERSLSPTLHPLENGGEILPSEGVEAAWSRVLEVKIPWSVLSATPGDRLLIQAAVNAGGQELDRAPSRIPIISQVPSDEWIASHWMV